MQKKKLTTSTEQKVTMADDDNDDDNNNNNKQYKSPHNTNGPAQHPIKLSSRSKSMPSKWMRSNLTQSKADTMQWVNMFRAVRGEETKLLFQNKKSNLQPLKF